MSSIELLSRLRSHNIRLRAENDQLRYSAPKGVMTDDLLAEIRTHKAELLQHLKNADRFRRAVSLCPVERTDTLPLSFAQERLWFVYHLFPESPAYNFSLKMRLAGILDISALQKSLQALIDRHESLRTCLPTIEDRPVQVILDDCPISLSEHDLEDLPEAERETAAYKLIEEEFLRPFDLTHGPVIRAALLRMADQDHILVITLHHIATDAWSNSIFQRDLAALYNAQVLQQNPSLPALPIQYVDFAHWQRQWMTEEVLEDQLRYWRTHLAELPALDLPLDHPRPPVQTHSGASYGFRLSKSLCQGIKSLSRQAEVTLATTLLAAFQVLLGRYSGQTDIVVGMPIANRTRSELENLVGFFVNSLVMRTDLSGDPSFREVLTRVHDVALGAYEHQDLPFEQLVEELQTERDLSKNPLFQTIFAFQNVPREPAEFHGLTSHPMGKDSTTSHMDLECFVEEVDGELCGTLVFNTDLFDRATIERFGTHFQNVLTEVVRDPVQRLSQISLLDETERRQLLVELNATERDYPRDATLAERFEAQAAATPDGVALLFEEQQLTYRELSTRTNQLARYLRQHHGVGPEVCVGLYMERSVEMVVGVLGIVKAGGAYVPLDPNAPAGRLAFMLEDADIALVLTQDAAREELPAEWSGPVIALDSEWPTIVQTPSTELTSGATAENLAYIMYTSGSTGVPKGTSICQRSVMRLVKNTNYLEVGPADTFLQFAPLAFDASTLEIWGGLLNGAKLVVFSPHQPSLEELGRCLREHEISTLWLTAALFHQMADSQPEALRGVRQLFSGGDVLSVPHVQRVLANLPEGGRLINGYGPTENTTFTCCHVMTGESRVETTVPIGRPIANTQVYVLDQAMQPVPLGVYGELYIGGDGLARDYLRRPVLTAEKFVPHPFSDTPGARLYRTGDVVRYRADGALEFKGRQDHQVKLRGYRIELGEIEAVLGQHPEVQATVALVREDEPGEKRLVGYIVPAREPVSSSTLRRYLQQRIPDYMVPAHFVMLDALPVTPNGKVDRLALPAPDGVRPELDAAYQAPGGRVEQTLAQIWTEVLRIDQVGRQDNFFELGGDSILSIQIVAKAGQAGLRVTPRHLFQYQTIAGLAEVVETREQVTADQGIVTGALPLSPVQHWFFAQQSEEPAHWNMAWVLEAKQPVDPEKMKQVVGALSRHHDALRLRFIPHRSGWTQELGGPDQPVPFTFIDLSHLPCAEAEAAYTQDADRLHASLDLSEGPLIRVALLRFGGNQADRVLLVIHHLAVDGISWRILLDDLQTAYDQLCVSKPIQLPPKTSSFKEWTQRLVEYTQSDTLNEEVNYWQTVAGTPWTPLPRDFGDGVNTVASTRTVAVELEREDTRALLQGIPEVYHTQINDVLLTALVDVLAPWSQQETVCLDLEGHGREEMFEDVDLSRTVGWFTSIFPVVLKRGHPAHPGELLKSVKEQL
ncbi:MAG: amino acid adenylation domain-containing protein, partial [Acidobacteria bacterium]|nr:amino acid adenylation domain-containing protein [Candidatus Sulfomarinibacter kjeldsenii]